MRWMKNKEITTSISFKTLYPNISSIKLEKKHKIMPKHNSKIQKILSIQLAKKKTNKCMNHKHIFKK
jgi:hypothetical protein